MERNNAFDWSQHLTEDELMSRYLRVGGDAICTICFRPYWKHPMEMRMLDWEDRPYLHRLCHGILGKL